MFRIALISVFVVFPGVSRQNTNRYLNVANLAEYRQEVKFDPEKKLVEIKNYIPDISLDIRYATIHNFAHHKMYTQAKAFARLPVVMALKQVEAAS